MSSDVSSQMVPLEMTVQEVPLRTAMQEIGSEGCGTTTQAPSVSVLGKLSESESSTQQQLPSHEMPLEGGYRVEHISLNENTESQNQVCTFSLWELYKQRRNYVKN